MHKRIWSFILTVGLMLALTPDTVMAANAERTQTVIRETIVLEDQAAPAPQPETRKKQAAAPAAVPSDLEGSGTATDPYRIKDAAQLRRFADAVNGVNGAPNTGICAVLTQNIDLSGVCGADTGSWTPIGTNTNPYRGTFDGASFAVSGLYCQKPGASYAGLFASNAGIIKNLGVAGGTVSAGNYAGGLCGINKGIITGCYNTASVNGGKYTGGICGCNDGGATVSVCYNAGAVNGGKYVGGICGYNKNTASDCYNTGMVIGSSTSIGGICGYNKKLVSGCYNTGEVGGGTNYVGSVCGYNHSGSTFVNCYYLVTGTEKGNYGVGMTQQQFASGEVCWALNEGNGGSVVWRQTCGTGLPAFGGKAVYRTQTYKSDGSAVFAYTNDGNKKAAVPYTAPTAGNSGESTNGNSGEHISHVYPEPTWEWKKYESAKAVFTCQDCGEQLILKASVKKETTEPTCTEDGETVYTASVERDGITYKDKRVVEKERKEHAIKKIDSPQNPTCTEPGYAEACYTCSICGKCFEDAAGKKPISKAKVGYIEPLGHNYGDNPSPTWYVAPKDPTTKPVVTATLPCMQCGAIKSVTAELEPKGTVVKPSCTSQGKRTYDAVAKFYLQQGKPSTEYRYSKQHPELITVKIPQEEHKYNCVQDSKGPYFHCTKCDGNFTLDGEPYTPVNNGPKTSVVTKEDAPKPDSDIEDETLTPDETIPGDEEPPLPPDSEETPDVPTPPEESGDAEKPDTPDITDESDNTDKPEAPGESGGANTPDIPDASDGADVPDTPDTPDVPDSSDGQNTPEAPDKSDGSAGTPDVPDESDNPNDLNLPESAGEWNETGTDAIESSAAAFRTTPAVNGAVQAAAKQQGIPLWGTAVLLTLVTGVVLLVILRGKHD